MKPQNEFSPERLSVISRIEQKHFWFKGRQKHIKYLIEYYIDQKVNTTIDIGCGTGFNLQFWSPFSHNVIGIDQYASLATYKYHNEKGISIVTGDISSLPVEDESADIVISLDVLEHVAESEMMKEVRRILRPNGKIIITVPALPCLWSHRDVKAGHLRRYTKKSLSKLFEKFDCEILYINYYQCLLLPLVIISRFIGRFKKSISASEEEPGKFFNFILSLITQLELIFVKLKIPLPLGSTLVVYAQKK